MYQAPAVMMPSPSRVSISPTLSEDTASAYSACACSSHPPLCVLFMFMSAGWHLPWPHPAAIRVPLQASLIHDAHTKWALPDWCESLPQHQLAPPGALAALMECAHCADSTRGVHANTWPGRAGLPGRWLLLLLVVVVVFCGCRSTLWCVILMAVWWRL
jgi:hypothetical protein